VVLFSTILLFMVVRSSLARMLAVIDQEFDIIEELKSAHYGLIFGSRSVNGFSVVPTLAFDFIAGGKNVLHHPFIHIRVVGKTVLNNFCLIHFGIQVAS